MTTPTYADAESARENHRFAMDLVASTFRTLSPIKSYLNNFVEIERGMHSYLHITNPTLYREALNSENLKHQVEIAKAALQFIAVCEHAAHIDRETK